MTNLTLLQRVCEQVNIERPSVLTSLTPEQGQMLRFLDEQHIELCGKKDWWFLQRTGDLSLWPKSSGTAEASTSGTTLTLASTAAFSATLTVNGKMQIGTATTAPTAYENDVVRVTASTTKIATILSTWSRGNVSTQNYWYGQDEYALTAACDRVSWVLTWRNGTAATSHRVLEAITSGEMESIRRNRSTYFTSGQPLYYCVLKHGATSDHIRSIVFDPFPEYAANVVYGYFLKPPTLYETTGAIVPALPPKYEQLLCDKTALQYYSTMGMGAPAGSPAGQDVQARIQETAKDIAEAEGQMAGDQKTAQELASMDSSGITRMFYGEQFGRSI